MFEGFLSKFRLEGALGAVGAEEANNCGVNGYEEFFAQYSGATFNSGLYRVHTINGARKFDAIAADFFPALRGRISCFGYDWLGRQFALDRKRLNEDGEPLVLMLEPGTGEVLEIPATFLAFHNEEVVEYTDAALAESFFQEWVAHSGKHPRSGECVGYKIPLFLGGRDEVSNLEIVDLDVYWHICGQLFNKTRSLPPGMTIGSVSID